MQLILTPWYKLERIINASPPYKRTCPSTGMKFSKHPLTCGSSSPYFYIQLDFDCRRTYFLYSANMVAFDDSKDIDARDNEDHVTKELYIVTEGKRHSWHSF